MRKNSIKNTRINEMVREELASIIRGGLKDPRVNAMTTVTAVEVAPDLKTAKAYISVLGDEKSLADTLKGLKNAEGYIRHCLAETVNLRNTPHITFIGDQSIEYGVRMSHLIDSVIGKDNMVKEALDEMYDADVDELYEDDADDEENVD